MSSASIAETLEIENAAKANGWTEEQLLNLAGERLGRAIGRHFPRPGTVVGYLGKGHNAGDALVALRILRDHFGWKIDARLGYPVTDFAPLTRKKWDELGCITPRESAPSRNELDGPLLLLDGLLGSGSSGSPRPPLRQLLEEMTHLRQHAGALIAAVDLPTGIDANCGKISSDTVTADITFMIGHSKSALLYAHAASATGALALIPIEPLAAPNVGAMELISPQTFHCAKKPRAFDFHKGMAGRVAIYAGSSSYSGAAVLAASGALRGGGGLITLFVPADIHSLIAAKCPPEIIVQGIENPRQILEHRFNSLVVGCGLGEMNTETESGLLELISNSPVPTVVDADAIHAISRSGNMKILGDRHVITPHPGEFEKLAPDLSNVQREVAARRFADRNSATLLLKGCRTIVTRRGAPLWCNSTGTPGMATGGQGDLLSGVIGARLAIGDPPVEAAALSAWLCGRSAEIALNESHISEESLVPSHLLHFLGAAFKDWRTSSR